MKAYFNLKLEPYMHSVHWKMAHDVSMSGSIATGFIVTTIILLCPLFYKLLQVSEIWQQWISSLGHGGEIRCFDTVFGRPYRCFWISITLTVILSLFNRYEVSPAIDYELEVCQNTVFIKLDITMTTVKKTLKSILKSEFCAI